jgi:hypothetical protein
MRGTERMLTPGCKRFLYAATCALVVSMSSVCAEVAKVVPAPLTKSDNSFYVGNRAPLLASPLIKLPIGAIKPEGWLRGQLELMADGFTGHLPQLSSFCQFEGNAWVSPTGEGKNGWEEVPYWLKGYGDLGYVLEDKRIIAEAEKWVKGMLTNHRPDGYFGPEQGHKSLDLWPNMPALHSLRSYYEYTGDKRVLTLMSEYFKWEMTVPLDKLLFPFWQKMRGGDNLDSIYWLYNRTGEKWLLDAARVIHERTADWTGGIPNWHGVNLGQGFREPGEYYQQTQDARYLKAAERNYDEMRGAYGQVPGGGIGADENCREGYTGPRQGTETCTWVEMMYSHEMLAAITGDVLWLDRTEDIAFNSLPASMTPDLKALHYLTCPNQIQLDRANKAPDIQNGGNMFAYDPYDFRCCQHNVAMGWPYYAERLWMATPGNGLAACLYSDCTVTAKVGSGQEIKISESTGYPFDENVLVTIAAAPRAVKFPMYLRIPGWCDAPKIEVNGKPMALPVVSGTGLPKQRVGGWVLLDRTWQSGDKVGLTLPMEAKVKVWTRNRNAVSVDRGPLTYSLKIDEDWRRYGKEDEWARWEVFPKSAWNYGLVLDPKDPAASISVASRKSRVASQPFSLENAPIELKAKAKRIPEWKQGENGMIGEIVPGPVISNEPTEEITLVPMGCARLRVSAFPTIGDGPDAQVWDAALVTATASHVGNSLAALNDGKKPANSTDQQPRFTWWDHRGTAEWVQYEFGAPRKLSWSEVYWYDDMPIGGQCWEPKTWKLLWWDGKDWQPVENTTDYKANRDVFNRVEFKPIETKKLRMEVQCHPNVSSGILEWRVGS